MPVWMAGRGSVTFPGSQSSTAIRHRLPAWSGVLSLLFVRVTAHREFLALRRLIFAAWG